MLSFWYEQVGKYSTNLFLKSVVLIVFKKILFAIITPITCTIPVLQYMSKNRFCHLLNIGEGGLNTAPSRMHTHKYNISLHYK